MIQLDFALRHQCTCTRVKEICIVMQVVRIAAVFSSLTNFSFLDLLCFSYVNWKSRRLCQTSLVIPR